MLTDRQSENLYSVHIVSFLFLIELYTKTCHNRGQESVSDSIIMIGALNADCMCIYNIDDLLPHTYRIRSIRRRSRLVAALE